MSTVARYNDTEYIEKIVLIPHRPRGFELANNKREYSDILGILALLWALSVTLRCCQSL
jgi:hypothetical protein